METNYAENNTLIGLFESFYDQIQSHKNDLDELSKTIKEDREEALKKSEEKKSFFDRFKKKEVKIYELPNEFVSSYNEIKNYLDNILSNPAQDFWTLWRLCQFVRWAEKVVLYKNELDSSYYKSIFVDSAINADEREFVFDIVEGARVYIKMELVQKPYIKITESAYNEVLTIMVQRSFGKKMENKFVVINGESDLIDDGDIYLINQINKHLNYVIRNTVKAICYDMLYDVNLQLYDKETFTNALEDFSYGYYGYIDK